MENNGFANLKKGRIILALVLVSVLIVVVVLSRYGRLGVDLVSADNKNSVSYTITPINKLAGKPATSSRHLFSKTLSHGDYEVIAKQGNLTGYAIVSVKSFFRTTHSSIKLKPQISRAVVGNDPNDCMNIVSGQLVSYHCGGPITNAKLHVPASASSPAYVVTNPSKYIFSFALKSIINTRSGPVAFVGATELNNNTLKNELLPVDKKLALGNGVELSDFKDLKNIVAMNFMGGIIAYDNAFKQVEYLETLTATPKKIQLNQPKNNAQKPIKITVFKDRLAIIYSDNKFYSDSGLDGGAASENISNINTSTEIHVVDASKNTTEIGKITTKKPVVTAFACSTTRLCVHNVDNSFEIYSLDGKLLYSAKGVRQAFGFGDNIRLLREHDLVYLDPDNMTGFSEYTFGELGYCGLEATENGYLLCITDSQRRHIVLNLDPNTAAIDSIDKALVDIPKISGVDTISVSNQFVYVAIKKGNPVYDPDARSFNFENKDFANIQKTVSDKLDSLDITTPKYTIKYL